MRTALETAGAVPSCAPAFVQEALSAYPLSFFVLPGLRRLTGGLLPCAGNEQRKEFWL